MSRRRFVEISGASCFALRGANAVGGDVPDEFSGQVTGPARGAEAGTRVLADGGNAVDAAVAAALVAAAVDISNCGIGGYGGHMVVGWAGGKVAAIDFNSAAPAAAREDMYRLDAQGRVVDRVNEFGWLAVGVPGTPAGLQLALDRFGTRMVGQLIEPAIRYARDGFPLDAGPAAAIRTCAAELARDPSSARLLLADGQPLAKGAVFKNPELAALLERLARDNSLAAFYRGEVAERLAREFQKHGGLVTEKDLAAYEAREVVPLGLDWHGTTIYTPPLTAGGLSVLEALATLKALAWQSWDAADPQTAQARVEALRVAWHDRLSLLGDSGATDVPVARLLSGEYAERTAQRVREAIRGPRLIPGTTDGRRADGTVHISAVDKSGMMVAVTLTHGGGFGARVTVDGLGLILGHGMSRFEPRPGHPNSPRPGRRPLNNMCPTLVVRDGQPVVVLGAAGGRRIPNTLYDVLAHLVGRGQSLAEAAAAPRMHTEGDATLELTKDWPEADVKQLARAGYTIKPGSSARLNGIARDPVRGTLAQVP